MLRDLPSFGESVTSWIFDLTDVEKESFAVESSKSNWSSFSGSSSLTRTLFFVGERILNGLASPGLAVIGGQLSVFKSTVAELVVGCDSSRTRLE